MASYDELLKAVDVAVSQGNMEAAKEIGLMLKQQRMRDQPMPEPAQLGQAGMPAAIKSTIGEQFGKPAQVLAGAGAAPMIAGHAVAQLAGANNAPDIENWKAVRGATPYTEGGNLAGNIGMFGAMPLGAVGAGVRAAGGGALSRWPAIADMAATQGATAAATTPGDAGDRLFAGMMGVGGAAIPATVGAVQTGRRLTTRAGAQLGLAEGLRQEMGDSVEPLAAQLRGQYPASRYGVNPTAAMLTRNPTLEALETGSRTRTGDQWGAFDRMNANARWRALEDAAGTPKELEQLKAARNVLTKDTRETALHNARLSSNPLTGGSPYVQGDDIAPIKGVLQRLATGEHRPNADVQKMVEFVNGQLSQRVTPEQLYTVRKMLTDGVKGGMPNELTQAARAARPQRMEIIGEIDAALDGMTDGGWSTYLESYKLASPLINSREALLKVRDRLAYGRPEGEIPASLGEKAAPYSFGRLLEQHGTKQFGSKEIDQLIPQHRELARTLLSDLNAQAGVLSSATKMGSPTSPLAANAGRVNQITSGVVDAAGAAIPVAGGTLAASVKGSMARRNEEALAALLQNPQALADTLQRAKVAAELLRKSGRAGAGASAGARSGRE